MPWLLKFILPAAVDFLIDVLVDHVLPLLVAKTSSKIDDNILDAIKGEKKDIADLVKEKAKKI